MTERQAVRYIGTYLWRIERYGMIFTLLFAAYLGIVLGTAVDELVKPDEEHPAIGHILVEWIYLSMFPIFGLVMNKFSWGLWKDDAYSRRLAHWRSMPIPVSSIVKARMLQSLVTAPIGAIIFMGIQYAIGPSLRDAVTPLEWIGNGAVWTCYAFAILAFIVWLELGFSGKIYCIYYFALMFLLAAISVTLNLLGIHLFMETLELVRQGYAWVLIAGMAAVAVASLAAFGRLTENRVRGRSLAL